MASLWILYTDHVSELQRRNPRIIQRIAGISSDIILSQQAILVTRNRQDFEKILNLLIEDWTV